MWGVRDGTGYLVAMVQQNVADLKGNSLFSSLDSKIVGI